MSKRVLFITQFFYPRGSPQTHRVAKTAKYLPQYGWEPVVICEESTPESSMDYPHEDSSLVGCRICETVYASRRIPAEGTVMGGIYRLLMRGIPQYFPRSLYRALQGAADRRAAQGDIDAIVATSPIPMTLTVAARLSRKYGIPWVADFRDLPGEHLLRLRPVSVASVKMHLQMAACKSAGAITTVSEPLADQISRRVPGKDVEVVYNGFDPDDYPGPEPEPDRSLTIVYCGRIVGRQTPAPLLDALDLILQQGRCRDDEIRVVFYGVKQKELAWYLSGRRCECVVEARGWVPFDRSILAQRRAQALLLLTMPGVRGILTLKLFEYLGARRPILSVPGDAGAADALLEETGTGVVGRDPEGIARIMLQWLDTWRRKGSLDYHGRADRLRQYTRRAQAGRMAEVFDRVCRH